MVDAALTSPKQFSAVMYVFTTNQDANIEDSETDGLPEAIFKISAMENYKKLKSSFSYLNLILL